MSQLKAYPEYKDSDIEWLSDIPENWEIKKIKHAIENLNYRRIPLSADYRGKMTEKTYDYYGASGIIDKVDDYLFNETLILVGEDGANLYSRSSPLAFLASGKYWVNNHAHIMKPKKGNIIYYVNLLETIDYTLYVTGSAQPKLTQDAISNIWIPVPPIFEQEKIADFIKEKASEIDNLISDKERLIELLEEKRQAMITEAVTKGLDPNVKMKDSGIEWIGEIPEHWDVAKMKYFSDMKTGATPSRNTIEYWKDGTVNWMTSGEINQEYILNIKNKITELGFKNSSTSILPVNTVMIALNGQGKTKGKAAILKVESACNQSLAGFICDEKTLHFQYLYYFLKSKYRDLRGLVGDGLRDGISLGLLKKLEVSLPDYEEQVKIVSKIFLKENEILESSELIYNQISKLKEYRESLIYEAVTGKIDVRDYATETEEVY